jgi:hypothetical protein
MANCERNSRSTYGAADNIVLEFWMADHFMGDEFRAAEVPPMRIKACGTAKVASGHGEHYPQREAYV